MPTSRKQKKLKSKDSLALKKVRPFMLLDQLSKPMKKKFNALLRPVPLIANPLLIIEMKIKPWKKLIYFSQKNTEGGRIKIDTHKTFPPWKLNVSFWFNQELNSEELDSLVRSKNFTDFFNRSSKVVEKVLDYGEGDMIEMVLKDGIKSK